MTPTFMMVCISTVLPYSLTLGDQTTQGIIVYRTPPHCAAGMLPERQGPPAPPAAKPPAAKSEVAATTPTKAKKATQRPCKKGRARDSRGICGRWKR